MPFQKKKLYLRSKCIQHIFIPPVHGLHVRSSNSSWKHWYDVRFGQFSSSKAARLLLSCPKLELIWRNGKVKSAKFFRLFQYLGYSTHLQLNEFEYASAEQRELQHMNYFPEENEIINWFFSFSKKKKPNLIISRWRFYLFGERLRTWKCLPINKTVDVTMHEPVFLGEFIVNNACTVI